MPTNIPFKITVCGIDELPEHSAVGVTHVLSILDPAWPVPDAFGTFGEHERLELRFHDLIEDTADMLVPEREPGAHLLVHCHAGISRSTASMILIVAQARPQVPAEAIVQEIFRMRPKAWPNLRIIEMGDAMLGRGGTLVAAVTAVYREQLAARPHLAELMIGGGREREVAAGRLTSVAAAPPAR